MSDCTILLVEDDANDAFFLARALKQLGFSGQLKHVSDTEVAQRYLNGAAPYSDRVEHPLPDAILADSNIKAGGSGLEFLESVRSQVSFRDMPFVLYCGALSPAQQQRAEAARVNGIFVKPSDFQEMVQVLREILLSLPPHCNAWMKSQ